MRTMSNAPCEYVTDVSCSGASARQRDCLCDYQTSRILWGYNCLVFTVCCVQQDEWTLGMRQQTANCEVVGASVAVLVQLHQNVGGSDRKVPGRTHCTVTYIASV